MDRRSAAALYALAFCLLFGCSTRGTSGLNGEKPQPQPIGCKSDDACPADQHCENQACVAGTGNACTQDTDCGAGKKCHLVTDCGARRCHGNQCVAKTCMETGDCPPKSCAEDSECMADAELCIKGTCMPKVACMRSNQCPSELRCVRSACREPCQMASDCGMGIAWNCNRMTGECEQRCGTDGNCPNGAICEGFICVPAQCRMNGDCNEMNAECRNGAMGHGRCVVVIPCDDQNPCPDGMACNAMHRCEMLPRCVSDHDCGMTAYCEGGLCRPSQGCAMTGTCPMGQSCVGNVCVPGNCRGDADCAGGLHCIAGACAMPENPSRITQVRILTPAGVVRPQTTYQFTAVALDQTGRVIPGLTIMWQSSTPAVATIAQSGLATGGAQAGTTLITASVFNGTTNITSPGVALVNLGPIPDGLVRVSVVGLAGGSPVSGTTVVLQTTDAAGSIQTLRATTDASGTTTFSNVTAQAFAVTAAHPGYDFVSVLGLSSRDVLIALPPVTKPSLAGGVKGTVDFAHVRSMGALSFSLSGTSLASPILAFDPALLFGGDIFTVNVPNPTNPTMTFPVPAPAGSTIGFELGALRFPLKSTYYARAQTGVRAVWSFAGRMGIDVLTGGGGLMGGNLLGAVLPYLQRFDHAVRPVIDVVALPTVPDDGSITGSMMHGAQIPDYANFPNVALTPDAPQSLRYNLSVGTLPSVSGGAANALIVIAGVLLPGAGFVPLGLDGQQTSMGGGMIAPFTTKLAPPHGGLEVGDYVVLATAIRLLPNALPKPGSARVLIANRLPENVALTDGWLNSPVGATWNGTSRQVLLPGQPGASFYRVAFFGADGGWNVYSATPGNRVGVPILPNGLVDRTLSATITIDAISLQPNTSASSLFDVAGGGVLALDRATRGFARAAVSR